MPRTRWRKLATGIRTTAGRRQEEDQAPRDTDGDLLYTQAPLCSRYEIRVVPININMISSNSSSPRATFVTSDPDGPARGCRTLPNEQNARPCGTQSHGFFPPGCPLSIGRRQLRKSPMDVVPGCELWSGGTVDRGRRGERGCLGGATGAAWGPLGGASRRLQAAQQESMTEMTEMISSVRKFRMKESLARALVPSCPRSGLEPDRPSHSFLSFLWGLRPAKRPIHGP